MHNENKSMFVYASILGWSLGWVARTYLLWRFILRRENARLNGDLSSQISCYFRESGMLRKSLDFPREKGCIST